MKALYMDTMTHAVAQDVHLTRQEVTDFMRALRYKNWRISLDVAKSVMLTASTDHELLVYPVEYVALNTREAGITDIIAHIVIWPPAFRNLDELQAFVMGEIGRIELHETREHLLVNGQRPYDPHTDEGNRAWASHKETFRKVLVAEGLPEASDAGQYFYSDTEYLRAA